MLLDKTLKWTDAFALSMSVSGAIFASFGFALGYLGAFSAIFVWVFAALIGSLQNWFFLEAATIFPDKSGGIALIATEGWKDKFSLAGPIASFGYWMGWSAVLSIVGVSSGSIIKEQWFPNSHFVLQLGFSSLELPQIFAIVIILLFWMLNRRGIDLAARVSKIMGLFLLIPVSVLTLAPFSNDWHFARLWQNFHLEHFTTLSGFKILAIWLFLVCWSSYGTEMCASFAPEYRTTRDMKLSLISSGFYTVLVFLLVGIGISGLVDAKTALANPNGFYIDMFVQLTGERWAPLFTISLLFALFMGVNAGIADGSRALYGMAQEGLTLKQFSKLNKHNIPERCIIVAVFINVLMIIFLKSPLAILVAANLGYVLSIFFALTGYCFLKTKYAHQEREIKLSQKWVPSAYFLSFYTLIILFVGVLFTEEAGYGSVKELLIGVLILLTSFIFYWFRKTFQK
ncbi:APC family permease [Acinetobacter baumannii]|uniref:APC family permease n=1 Tax=Acinetobacter calcoaceticus/baumannii complex TaxID=909768 RepID=UPI001EE54CA5|nr:MULTISPECIES: APC family permease [Acinetobacter calcoaceticus/baumannii complex]MCG5227015.1 APC family permease [Acinetobacter pittii]MDO7443043.1 APC family permease [Acinetobacter baumannii]MDV7414018.1 APC family permease [Acinetobacter baumannii]MDV7456908.1 APC family permease [Acinetobacter baumannii]